MLLKLREQTQGLAFKVLVGMLVFVLAVFGFGAFNLFGSGETEVARVNGEAITESALIRETERERRRLAAQFGDAFDDSLIDPLRLQGAVLEQMIARELLVQATDEIRVGVSQQRVDRTLVANPGFQIDGRFQPGIYRQAVMSMGYSPQEFVAQTARLLALDQLQNLIVDTAFITDQDLVLHARLLDQRRDFAYLPFVVERFLEQVELTDEEVALFYQENQRQFETEESVDAVLVELTRSSLLDDPSISVSEDAVRELYEAERQQALGEGSGEQRSSRHILLEVTGERSAEQARAELSQVRERLLAGESFAELAAELSEDAGSANQGGDLGFIGEGVFDPAFETALFALAEPGDISEPVETDFGVHLIQLDAVRTREYPAFEQARKEIATRLAEEQAEGLFAERLRELDNLAFENPGSLEAVAQALETETQSVAGVTRTTGEGLFAEEEVRAALFDEDVLRSGFNSRAVEYAPGRAVVVRVGERYPSEVLPLEQVADAIRERLTSERARALLEEAQRSALARVQAGDSVSEVAASHGLNWQVVERASRQSEDLPREILQVAFALPRPQGGAKSVGEARLPNGGAAVVTVTRVVDGDLAAMSTADAGELRRLLDDRAARLDFSAFYESVEQRASIRRAL